MPTYEYRCNACGKDFEYQQRMSDDDLVTCEACGEPKLEKLISRTAFQLKGSGWYKDLYSSNPKEAVKSGVDQGVPAKADAPAATGTSESAAPASSSSDSSSGSGTSGSSSGSSSGGSTPPSTSSGSATPKSTT